MLSPFAGQLLLVATVVVVGAALGLALWAATHNARKLRAAALRAAAGAALLFAGVWVLGIVLARTRVLSPGSQLSFCGLDCHLHVSVVAVRHDGTLGVTVRFASNAVRAPEYPARLRFRLRDDEGREFAPLNEVPDVPLPAGQASAHELRFPPEARPEGAVLIVTWDRGLDYLVPGAGNVLVQRRTRLAIQ